MMGETAAAQAAGMIRAVLEGGRRARRGSCSRAGNRPGAEDR